VNVVVAAGASDAGVVHVIEASKIVIRTQDARLDSRSQFKFSYDIAFAKLSNVLPVSAERRGS
jgi:hypothetical protein